jgi:PAS domain S-box-containing protein
MEQQPLLLVVDDEPGFREGIRRIFMPEGYDVTTAENGTEGIRKGLEREFDIVLLDLKMPDFDGITVLRTLRLRWPDTEYIIITAFAGIDSAVEATKVGAYTYVAKPFDIDQIVFEVSRAMDKRRLTIEARDLRMEQERRLLEITQEKSRLRTIINSISDAVFVTNLMDEIVLANPQTRSLFRLSSTIKYGTKIDDILPQEVVEQIHNAAVKAGEGVESVSREWEMKPGAELVVMMNTAPVKDASGMVIGFVTTMQDVTELKRLDMQKSQFVSMVAHELKAPLAAISGYLDTMDAKLLGNDLEKYLTMIGRSRERLRALIDLINDLLNISRMDMGTVRREVAAIDPAQAILGTLEFLRQEMQKKRLSLVTEFPDTPCSMDIDKEEFNRLMTNLLSNAIKYNRDGGEIRVTIAGSGDSVRISVKDSGIGMTPEETAQLFQQFYRAKNEQTRSIPGTGLGLSIVKRIVDSYHGDVQAESVCGEGTTFIVRLPRHFVGVDTD